MKGVAAFVAVSAVDAAVLRGQNTFQAQLQPELVARTFQKVEDEWRNQALLFANCNATEGQDCSGSEKHFVDSCATLVGAVVKASSGVRSNVIEYMGDICSQPNLKGWHKDGCTEFGNSLVSSMGIDSYSNRENLNSHALCTGFWTHFSTEQKALYEKERVQQEEDERKAAEERVKEEAEKRERMKKEEEQRIAAEKLAAEAAKQKAEDEAAAKKAADEAAAKEAAEKEAAEKEAAAAAAKAAEEAEAKTVEQASANSTDAKPIDNATVMMANATSATTNVSTQVNMTTDVVNSTVAASADKPVAANVTAMADQIAAEAVAAPNMSNATVADAPALVSNASATVESNATVETNATK